tara:strand:- start:9157 stop:9381 length:225 start_codon:yes stop_codon:yes gene_type:complete
VNKSTVDEESDGSHILFPAIEGGRRTRISEFSSWKGPLTMPQRFKRNTLALVALAIAIADLAIGFLDFLPRLLS